MTPQAIVGQIDGPSPRGVPVARLADPIIRCRAAIPRARNEARARRLLAVDLDYVPHPSFDDPDSRAAILGPTPEPPDVDAPRRAAARRGPDPELAGLCDVPPLTPEQERHFFREMNSLKHCAAALRARIDPRRARTTDLDRLERLQESATAIRARIVAANLRLLAWIARRSARPSGDFPERVSDGIEVLIRAVDRFDFARGYKFSTYATCAIRNHFAGIVRKQGRCRDRFVTGLDEPFRAAIDDRDAEAERERSQERRREAVVGLLGRLDDRERRIIVGRTGLDGERERSLRELGAELGLTKERIRQLEVRAHQKLRALAGSREFDLVPA